jgi:hypothetical protein
LEDIDKKEELEKLPKEIKRTAIIVGLILAGSSIFGYFEA